MAVQFIKLNKERKLGSDFKGLVSTSIKKVYVIKFTLTIPHFSYKVFNIIFDEGTDVIR